MEARAAQTADISAVPQAGVLSSSVPLPRAVDRWRQAARVLAVAASLGAGLALVPPFAAEIARQTAIADAAAAYLDDAEAQLVRAISWTPQDAYLHQFLGEIYYRKALFRPQQRKAKEHDSLMKTLRSGDKIVTSSGIVGIVVSVKDKTVAIRSADTKLEILKSAVTEITERSGEPSPSNP